jgi:putative transposase
MEYPMDSDDDSYVNFLHEQSWKFIEECIRRDRRGRKPQWSIREIVSAIFYVCKTGCQWRFLPETFPPWHTISNYFRTWRDDGTWDYITRRLHPIFRESLGRDRDPSLIIIDSQSAKTTCFAGSRGIDGHKMVKGRKRTILVDTLGFVMAVSVGNANEFDGNLAPSVLKKIRKSFRLRVCFADEGYRGQVREWSFRILGIAIKTVKKSKDPSKIVTKKRWIVERSFSWLLNYRRLAMDYERSAVSEEAWIKIANIAIALRRLEHLPGHRKPLFS